MGAGAGAELRQPLGIAIVGGLCVSQLLTLFITPVVYYYLDKVDSYLSGRNRKVAVAEHAPVLKPAE
jgi:HAE1 family hydrophobic/amphiphilic exporter-1